MELSRRDFFKASGVALLALTAACTPIIAGEHTDPQLPKDIATSPASTGTPYPEGIYVGGGEASLQAERDPIQIAKEVENFDNAQVDWYDKAGDLQTSESGKESGFVLLGVLNANLSDNASVNNKFGYITGPGGEEHLAQKINDNRWIVLAYKELPEPNGNVLNAFGYSSQGIFLPILSVEFTTSGEPTGSVWFFDISVNRFYKISDPENHGKPGMMALAQVENKHILVGKDLMKDNEDKKWNFVWQKDGSLTISGSDDIILYTFDKESGKWAVERPIKEFPWCKDMHLFEQCVIDVADLQEHGRFAQSTLTEDLFDPTQLKTMTEYSTPSSPDGELLVPNIETAPNYKNEKTAPFKKDYMFGISTIDDIYHYVIQVPYYVEGVAAKDFPVITGVAEDKGGGYTDRGVMIFSDRMNVVPWNISDLSLATQYVNPQTGVNFTFEEVQSIIEEMKVGNFANTNGLVLKFEIGINSGRWFE